MSALTISARAKRASYVASNVTKNCLAPVANAIAPKRGTLGSDFDESSLSDAIELFASGIRHMGVDVMASNILEIGHGRTPEVAMWFAGIGASVTSLDVTSGIPDDSTTSDRAGRLLEMVERSCPNAAGLIREAKAANRVASFGGSWPITFSEYDGQNIPLRSKSVDLIVSKSTLEHVRRHQVQPLVQEMTRVLKPDGAMLHYIDFRDHMHIQGDHEVHGDWLDCLTYGPRMFSAMFSNRSTYVNRLRLSEWLSILEDAGASVKLNEEKRFPLDPSFSSDGLAVPWRNMPVGELEIGAAYLGLRPRSA